jgi:phage-related protein
MFVVKLGAGSWGQVLALALTGGEIPVLEYLRSLDASRQKAVAKMLRQLREYVPEHGPPVHNTQQSNRLGDGIFELKVGDLRALYFYDEGRAIVCTHAFAKKRRKTPPREIHRAKEMRQSYFAAKKRHELTVVSL